MFGDPPSATLPLQLLRKATERAREKGGRPSKAVSKMWRLVMGDTRTLAALGELAETPETLADWLAATGGDESLAQLLCDQRRR